MVTLRLVDLRLLELWRSEEIPAYTSAAGEEGALAAPAMALDPGDAFFPGPREALASLVRGLPLEAFVQQVLGTARSGSRGRTMPGQIASREHRIGSVSGVAGAHLPHAVGFAWAGRKERRVTLAAVGDGASSKGDFHNALNFAGVMKAPVIFLCRNDESVPLARETAASGLAEKGEAYGVPASRVDGRDALAVYAAVSEAASRARAGGGPSLIEVLTVHALPEAGKDRASCPIAQLEGYLERGGVDARRERADAEEAADRAFRSALAEARASGAPPRASMFEDVYGDIPPHLLSQRDTPP